MYEVTGKYISVKHGDIQLLNLAATLSWPTDWLKALLSLTKSYTQYLKEYMKRLQAKMVESDPNFNLDEFKQGMNKVMKELIGRFKDLQFFTGENMDIDGMVALMEYRDVDGESRPVMMFFKHGLEAEKF